MGMTSGRATMSETVQSIVGTTVASLNARAVTTTVQCGDTAIVVAMNKAAVNTLRAFAGLIARRAYMVPEIYSVVSVANLLIEDVMRGACDSTSSPGRVAQLTDAHLAEATLSEPGSATHTRAPTRAWTDIAEDMDTLGGEIQRSIDRYYKWLVEMCQRTADVDPGLSGGRIGRLRRRRDREFDRLMHRYSVLGVHGQL